MHLVLSNRICICIVFLIHSVGTEYTVSVQDKVGKGLSEDVFASQKRNTGKFEGYTVVS